MKKPILKKNAKIVTKPIKSLTEVSINKQLDSLKSRSTSKNANYKKRNKEIDLKIKELNKEAKPGEHFFFNGKEIVKFNYNPIALQNITKLLSPKDKKILRGISAEISLRISKQIIKNNVTFINNFGQIENMTPKYLLSLPLDKLKTLITPYEYKKLFSIIKRVPEKNLNYIVRNYSEITKISEKNKFIFAANVLLKASIADAKGLLEKVPSLKEKFISSRNSLNKRVLEKGQALKEKASSLRMRVNEKALAAVTSNKKTLKRKRPIASFEEKIKNNYPLYAKHFSQLPAFNALESYEKYKESYFKLMEGLLKSFEKDFPGKNLPQTTPGLFERFVTEWLEGVNNPKRPSRRYNNYYSDLKNLIERT
jgi:hypothetical protein